MLFVLNAQSPWANLYWLGYWIGEDRLLIATQNGTWATLSLSTDDRIASATERLNRGLRADECHIYRIDSCPTLEPATASKNRWISSDDHVFCSPHVADSAFAAAGLRVTSPSRSASASLSPKDDVTVADGCARAVESYRRVVHPHVPLV